MCYWYGSEEEDRDAFIPDWCPLWNEQGKPMLNSTATTPDNMNADELRIKLKKTLEVLKRIESAVKSPLLSTNTIGACIAGIRRECKNIKNEK